MPKVIEAVYEKGVIKPLEKIIGQEGAVLLIEIRRVKGVFTREEIENIKRIMEKTKKYTLTKEELVDYGKIIC